MKTTEELIKSFVELKNSWNDPNDIENYWIANDYLIIEYKSECCKDQEKYRLIDYLTFLNNHK